MHSHLVAILLAVFCLRYGCAQNCDHLFQCDNGNCVANMLICDGVDDCGDMSDEPGRENCKPCDPEMYQCKSGKCIPPHHICDGVWDCRGEGDDEIDQDTGMCPKCPESTFACNDGSCAYREYICDGCRDCRDWSDEIDSACPCADNEFRCARTRHDICEGPGIPGACIPSEKICDKDGIWDCPDGSDEVNCDFSARQIFNHDRLRGNMSRH